jgi:hypothetical protein
VTVCLPSVHVFVNGVIEVRSYRWAGDVGQVGSDTGRVHNIVESELSDELARLEEEGQWLCHVNRVLELPSSICTCPMPPAAPATTALTILLSYRGREL